MNDPIFEIIRDKSNFKVRVVSIAILDCKYGVQFTG